MMSNDDNDKKSMNDRWRQLVQSGRYKIDVADACSGQIDRLWTEEAPTRFTSRTNTGALPFDYELTVRRVTFHVLHRRDRAHPKMHGIYTVDDYSMRPVRMVDVALKARKTRARRRKPAGAARRHRAPA
jgi:hypothetical protein